MSGPPTHPSSEQKTVIEATWHVELTCDCPACGEYVDLLEAPDFWDCRHMDICEHRTPRTEAVEVICPKCEHEFEIRTVY